MRLERFKNQKIFLPRERGNPIPWTPYPTALAHQVLANTMYTISVCLFKICLKMHLERLKIKNFLSRERGYPFPWTPTPIALALWALPHTKYSIDVAYYNLLFRALYHVTLLCLPVEFISRLTPYIPYSTIYSTQMRRGLPLPETPLYEYLITFSKFFR